MVAGDQVGSWSGSLELVKELERGGGGAAGSAEFAEVRKTAVKLTIPTLSSDRVPDWWHSQCVCRCRSISRVP